MRVVLDTVVFVRSLINLESYCGRIVFTHANKYELILSKPTFTEFLEVLQRPELTRKFSTLANLTMQHVLDIVSHASIVELGSIPEVSRDIKDDKFLATAVAAKAEYLVSQDEDLLTLKTYEGVRIVTCKEFTDILELPKQ